MEICGARLRSRPFTCALVLAVLLVVLTAATASASSRLFFSTSVLFTGKLWSIRPDGSDRELLRSHVLTGPTGVTATISRNRKRILCLCRKAEIDSMRLDGSHMHAVGRRPVGTKYDVVSLGTGGEAIWIEERHDRLVMQRADRSHRVVLDHGANGRYIEGEFAIDRAGRKVAYETQRCAEGCAKSETELWIKRIGGRKTRVYRTVGKRAVGDFTWSGDGSVLAFTDFPDYEQLEKYEEPEDPNSYLFIHEGGHSHEGSVTAPAGPFPMAFSPDGKELAVAGEESRGSIYTVTAGGAGSHLVFATKCGEACFWPPWAFGWIGD
jgi:hypothetical protein